MDKFLLTPNPLPEPAWKSTWRASKSFAFIAGMLSYQTFFITQTAPSTEQLNEKIAQIQKIFGDQEVQNQLKKDPQDFAEFCTNVLKFNMDCPEVVKAFLECTQVVSQEPPVITMYWNALIYQANCRPSINASTAMVFNRVKQSPQSVPIMALHRALESDNTQLAQMVVDTLPSDTLQQWMLKIPRTVRRRGNQSLALVRQALKASAQHQALTQACAQGASSRPKSPKM